MKYVDIKSVLVLARNIASDAITLSSHAAELRSRLSALEGSFLDDGFDEVDAYSKSLLALVLNMQGALGTVTQQLIEYAELLQAGKGGRDSFLSYSGANNTGSDFPKHLSPEETNARWKSAVNSIDEQIENYREALLARGVPDCAWLSSLLATHRANMLEQSGYDLDVASGKKATTTNRADAYQYPGDYTSFYNQLASEFFSHCATATNPNYNSDSVDKWYVNCQRCVPTYELLRRGKNVTALPCISDYDYLSASPFSVWENPIVIHCTGNDQNEIESSMKNWGDGARAQITVMWTETQGHTFVAEQRDGKTHYIDPQSGNENYTDWIDSALPGKTQFCRIDNLETSDLIKQCYREIKE